MVDHLKTGQIVPILNANWITDHSITEQLCTIWKPDTSGFRIPTVFRDSVCSLFNRHRLERAMSLKFLVYPLRAKRVGSEASGEVAHLTERKNSHTPV